MCLVQCKVGRWQFEVEQNEFKVNLEVPAAVLTKATVSC
jgi:hypothetical protein